MPCGTVVGDALSFGIDADEASLVTQSITVTHRKDKKEARDNCGIVVSVAYYNPTTTLSIRGLGASSASVGATLSLTGSYVSGGSTYIDEISIDYGNEDFVESTVEATNYPGF